MLALGCHWHIERAREREGAKPRRHSFNPQALGSAGAIQRQGGASAFLAQAAIPTPSKSAGGLIVSGSPSNWLTVDQNPQQDVQKRRNSGQIPPSRSTSLNVAVAATDSLTQTRSASHCLLQQPTQNHDKSLSIPATKHGSRQHDPPDVANIPATVPLAMANSKDARPKQEGVDCYHNKKRSGSGGGFKFSRMPLIGKNIKLFDSKKTVPPKSRATAPLAK